VNVAKTNSTCLEWMADGKSPPQREQKERMERELTWNGIPISFLHKSEPYKYLGVELRFDLSAVDHESSIRRQIIHALTCLDDCFLYQKDIWHIATTRLAPKAQYALSLGLYYESHIEKLQSLLLGCVRSSLGLLHSTSTAMRGHLSRKSQLPRRARSQTHRLCRSS